jgi:hypothetical protein
MTPPSLPPSPRWAVYLYMGVAVVVASGFALGVSLLLAWAGG